VEGTAVRGLSREIIISWCLNVYYSQSWGVGAPRRDSKPAGGYARGSDV
jgi:hypothetical protein